MYRYVITRSLNNHEIYVNLISSSAGQYLSRHPHLINLIKQVLSAKNLSSPAVSIERDMGRVIGNTDIVETTETDTIFYAQPIKKEVFTRYAKNRDPIPSKTLSIKLARDSEGNYEVLDTWIGPYTPPFPGDENETAKSKSYWESHAITQNLQVVQTKTITKISPY